MKTTKLKIATFLPIFPGFYNTIFEASNEESEIEEINRIREEKGLNEINYDDCIFDYKEYELNVSKQCTNFVENELRSIFNSVIKVEFEELISPRYYNYSNDSINVSIEIGKKGIKEIKKYLIDNKNELETYLERYKSCDGFISSYSHYSDVWINEYLEQIEDKVHILGAVLDFILRNEISEPELDMYYSISDNYVFATNFTELTEVEE